MKAGWTAALLMVTVCLHGAAQTRPVARFPLTADKIARAFASRGTAIGQEQISMLANVVAAEENPILDVLSVQPLGGRRAEGHSETQTLVKLSCRAPGTCLPFYVVVNSTDTPAGSARLGAKALSHSLLPPVRPNLPVTMRAGDHATLIMEDSRAHVQMSVVSLESGRTGDKIRVATPDRRQTYVAEVLGANLVRRSL